MRDREAVETLRVTPAMAAGLTDKLMDWSDVVRMIENWELQAQIERAYGRDGQPTGILGVQGSQRLLEVAGGDAFQLKNPDQHFEGSSSGAHRAAEPPDAKRMRSTPSAARSRTRGQRTATGPMRVMIWSSGRYPCLRGSRHTARLLAMGRLYAFRSH
jgi:hypothetical protein